MQERVNHSRAGLAGAVGGTFHGRGPLKDSCYDNIPRPESSSAFSHSPPARRVASITVALKLIGYPIMGAHAFPVKPDQRS